MRLHFTLSPNREPVPFAYQHKLTGVFHKWLANNDLHDKISLYSLSWLDGSQRVRNKLEFPNGAKWFVSFYEDAAAEKLGGGALKDPEMFGRMHVEKIEQQTTPDFGAKYTFKVASPVFVKGKQPENGKPPHHYLFNEPEADEIMTATLVHKMDAANRAANETVFTGADKQIKGSFDREFRHPKIKLVRIKEIDLKASVCPIIVEGHGKSRAIRVECRCWQRHGKLFWKFEGDYGKCLILFCKLEKIPRIEAVATSSLHKIRTENRKN